MREPPSDFATDELVAALGEGWGLAVTNLEYLALGFGGHHWRASTAPGDAYFLSLNDSQLEVLRQTYGGARWLETTHGLEFVVGPLPDCEGKVVRPLGERFALSVYPWLDAQPVSDADGTRTAALLSRLHRAPPDAFPMDDFRIPCRTALEQALAELATPWCGGPYSEPARDTLRAHAQGVRALLRYYDRLAAATANRPRARWVLTHGEPYGPNLLQAANGRVHLVDWDSARIAPRERDLWELPSAGLAAYCVAIGQNVEQDALHLYRAWYDLAEVGIYIAGFRSAHRGDQNDAVAWHNLQRFVRAGERWPELRVQAG